MSFYTMENIKPDNLTKVTCKRCKNKGHFSFCEGADDEHSCPMCSKIFNFDDDYSDLFDEYLPPGSVPLWSYCSDCKLLFKRGCLHANNGCMDLDWNAHFISKWRYIPTGEIHTGMPKIENAEAWAREILNIDILEEYCPDSIYCSGASYNTLGDCTINKTRSLESIS